MNQRQPPLGVGGVLAVTAMLILSTAVAIWTSTQLVAGCIDAVRLRNSVLVDARVLNIEVIERGEAGDAVYITYAYEYEGEAFQHRTQRLATFSHSKKSHQAINEALRTGEVVPCHIDPDKPSLSVFSKEFSMPLFLVSSLFPLVFGGVAIIIATSLIHQRLRIKRYREWRRT